MPKRKDPVQRGHDESGADLPVGMPYTLYFPRRGGHVAADIEYTAPLPRIGDAIEYIDDQAKSHRYRVVDVVHTFQHSPLAEGPDAIELMRAGLPAVYLVRDRRKPRRG
jgi:hypothetical protein